MDRFFRRTLFTPLKPSALAISALLAIIAPQALSDSGLPRYVASDGSDTSDCTNLFRPCKSPIFAIDQSTKTDRVYLAKGEYPINTTDEVFTVVANSYRLYGGYSRITQYNAAEPNQNTTTLIGIPAAQRDGFAERGFRIVSDLKHMHATDRKKTQALSKTLTATSQSHGKIDCNNGTASSFSCENINMLSHLGFASLPLSASAGNDIWGFVDLNTQREYAIIGLDTGVAVIDITDGEAPFAVGSHDGLRNDWRDIKIYQHYDSNNARWNAYAYVTTEASQGLVVIDMTGLPNSIETKSYDSDITSAHNVYIAGVDYTFGARLNSTLAPTLTVAGARNGGVNRAYSLTNPGAPNLIRIAGSGYMHDGSSALITDGRQVSQCINGIASNAPCTVYADFNEDAVVILDLTDPNDPEVLSTITYSGSEYVHSGWWSEDTLTLFVHDELDEFYGNTLTQVRAFDMSNLRAPTPAGSWTSSNRSIDHNGFSRGNRYYMSNYTAGLTILDITDPATITRAGYFDTVPASDATQFSGAWGAYPYYPSGKVAISDINSGLYVLHDNTLDNTAGSFRFTTQHITAEEGDALSVMVERINGTSGEVTVDIELQHLTTGPADTAFERTTLSWPDGNSTSQSFSLPVATDGLDEPIERAALWLKNPQGGATIVQGGLAYLHVADPDNSTSLNIMANQTAPALETQPFIFVVQRTDGTNENVSVDYDVSLTVNGASTSVASGAISWAEGETHNKVITVPTSSLSDLPIATNLSVSLLNATNAQLENSSLSITLRDEPTTTPTTPTTPTQPNNNASSGGGNLPGGALILLTGLLIARKARNYPKRFFQT